MANRKLFAKWSRWLDQIKNELIELVVQQRHFHELQDTIAPHVGEDTGVELARWIAQAYYAYACLAVRRLVEGPKSNVPKKGDPKLTISLVVLLEDLATNNSELIRARTRRLYLRHMRHLGDDVAIRAADRDFDQVARKKRGREISVSRIKRDIASIRKAAKRIKRRVDKVYAHTERDRRRIGKPLRLVEIDAAIKTLVEMHRLYALLIQGRDVRGLAPAEFEISSDLRKIWP